MYKGRRRRRMVGGRDEEEEEEEEEEVSLGVIMTNTEIKFHILLFTLSSSSVSQSLSFILLQSLYCPLRGVVCHLSNNNDECPSVTLDSLPSRTC
jgi:hypothetical protein